MHVYQIVIFLVFFGILDATFFCYHGKGQGDSFVKKTCPSKICIIYVAACGWYASTTCYNPQNPMKVVNNFKAAAFYYNHSPQSSSFVYCTTSECNKIMMNITNPIIIHSDPASFDSMLSTSVKQEELKKQLQNGIKLLNGIANNETFKFIGQTFKAPKIPWIAFSCTYNNGTTMRFYINFDIKFSKLISKTITVVSATQKTKQLNQTWTNPIKVGGKITVILKNNNPKFELSVNNAAINGFLNDNTIKDVTLVTYGGGWKMNGASLIDTKGKTIALKMLPTFYSDIIPINVAKLKGNLDNIKLVAQPYSLVKPEKENKLLLDTVDRNRMTNYEFRISADPQSDLVKLQFQSFKFFTNAEYVILWKRVKSVWYSAGIVFLNNGLKCTDYNIGVASTGINFYCGKVNAHNISFPNLGYSINYRIQNFGMPETCAANNPFHRLLGRMPPITQYSF